MKHLAGASNSGEEHRRTNLLTDSFHSSAPEMPHRGVGIFQSPKFFRWPCQLLVTGLHPAVAVSFTTFTRGTCSRAVFTSRLWGAWGCTYACGGYPLERGSWRRYTADKSWRPWHGVSSAVKGRKTYLLAVRRGIIFGFFTRHAP